MWTHGSKLGKRYLPIRLFRTRLTWTSLLRGCKGRKKLLLTPTRMKTCSLYLGLSSIIPQRISGSRLSTRTTLAITFITFLTSIITANKHKIQFRFFKWSTKAKSRRTTGQKSKSRRKKTSSTTTRKSSKRRPRKPYCFWSRTPPKIVLWSRMRLYNPKKKFAPVTSCCLLRVNSNQGPSRVRVWRNHRIIRKKKISRICMHMTVRITKMGWRSMG